jgi:hypothetical protein
MSIPPGFSFGCPACGLCNILPGRYQCGCIVSFHLKYLDVYANESIGGIVALFVNEDCSWAESINTKA